MLAKELVIKLSKAFVNDVACGEDVRLAIDEKINVSLEVNCVFDEDWINDSKLVPVGANIGCDGVVGV